MAPLTFVANLATRWRHLHKLQICPQDGATYISCKFGHKMVPLALVANLATRWHHLHYFQICPPDGVTCISCKFSHQMTEMHSYLLTSDLLVLLALLALLALLVSLVWTFIGVGPKNPSSSEVRLASDLFQIKKFNCHHGWEVAIELYSTVNSDNTSC